MNTDRNARWNYEDLSDAMELAYDAWNADEDIIDTLRREEVAKRGDGWIGPIAMTILRAWTIEARARWSCDVDAILARAGWTGGEWDTEAARRVDLAKAAA